jgi:hypothetical protein
MTIQIAPGRRAKPLVLPPARCELSARQNRKNRASEAQPTDRISPKSRVGRLGNYVSSAGACTIYVRQRRISLFVSTYSAAG